MQDGDIPLSVALKRLARGMVTGATYVGAALLALGLFVAGLFFSGTLVAEAPPYEFTRESLMASLISEEDLPPNWQVVVEPQSIQNSVAIVESDDDLMGHCNQPRIDQIFPDAANRGVAVLYGQGEMGYPNVAVLLWPFDEAEDALEMVSWMHEHWDCDSYTLDAEDSSTRFTLVTGDFEHYGEDEFKRRIISSFDYRGEEHRTGAIDVVSVRERNIVVAVSTTLAPAFPIEVDEEIESELTLLTDAFVKAALAGVKDLD